MLVIFPPGIGETDAFPAAFGRHGGRLRQGERAERAAHTDPYWCWKRLGRQQPKTTLERLLNSPVIPLPSE